MTNNLLQKLSCTCHSAVVDCACHSLPFVAIFYHYSCSIKNKFLILWCSLRIADIISESVSLILGRKIWRFGKHKDSNNTHHRVWLSFRYTNRCEVLFIYAWATPNAFYQINELPHTFFFIITAHSGLVGKKLKVL